MNFKKNVELEYASLEETMTFMGSLNIEIDEAKLFDQYVNLKGFWTLKKLMRNFTRRIAVKR